MKRRIFTKFGKINCLLAVFFFVYTKKTEILLILRDMSKISYFHEFSRDSWETTYIYGIRHDKKSGHAYVF